jgi:protein gp37
MANNSKIQWTDATWNIARGCSKVDEDCKFCYMYRESLNGTRYEPKTVTKTKTVFNLPLKLKEPSKIFTSSLTDFFHEECDSFRGEAWDIIRKSPQHTFQILTKRPERIWKQSPFDFHLFNNVWMGTSVGHEKGIERIAHLLNSVKYGVTFLSAEPLHGPLDLSEYLPGRKFIESENAMFKPLDWVIVGGESGNDNGPYKYRPCELEWIESIIDQCKSAGVPVFVKQLGTHLSKKMGLKDRHGGDAEEWPEHLRARQFPQPKG